MSLMNDVLQQLDSRTLPNSGRVPAMACRVPPKISRLALVRVVFVVSAVAAGVYWGLNTASQPLAPAPVLLPRVKAPAPAPAATPASAATPALAPETAPSAPVGQPAPLIHDAYTAPVAAVTSPQAPASGVNPAENTQQIAQWLAEASVFMEANQLMTPIGRCAFSRYQAVLLQDPNNAIAKDGLLAIQQRYVQYFQAALTEKNLQKAKNNLDKLVLAGLETQALTQYKNQWLQLKAEVPALALSTSPVASGALQTRIETETGVEVMGAAALAVPPPVISDAALARLAQAGKLPKAAEQLQAFLQTNPNAQEVPFALAQLYCLDKNVQGLQQLLDTYRFNPARYAYLKAKWALMQKDYPQVVQLLNGVQPEAAFQVDFQLVYALGLQNTGQFQPAADLYTQLLQNQPRNAQFWLGLGICYDALHNPTQAVLAFKKVQALGVNSSAVQQFVQEKLNALQP